MQTLIFLNKFHSPSKYYHSDVVIMINVLEGLTGVSRGAVFDTMLCFQASKVEPELVCCVFHSQIAKRIEDKYESGEPACNW